MTCRMARLQTPRDTAKPPAPVPEATPSHDPESQDPEPGGVSADAAIPSPRRRDLQPAHSA